MVYLRLSDVPECTENIGRIFTWFVFALKDSVDFDTKWRNVTMSSFRACISDVRDV